jgi:hypothetical protein
MRLSLLAAAAVTVGLSRRVLRSRHQRSLHPAGRSFTGDLRVWGPDVPAGSDLIDRPGLHPVTVRVSKGIGTRAGRPDVLGLAIRVYRPGRGLDLLLSTAGRGRLSRHLPAPRSTFDTFYGTITPYRTGTGRKVYLAAGPDGEGPPLGDTLESVITAARRGAQLVLTVDHDGTDRPFAEVTFGLPLPDAADAALAFDPVRNSSADLHPTGTVHGLRAYAYRFSQLWRGVAPAPDNPSAVARTAGHR